MRWLAALPFVLLLACATAPEPKMRDTLTTIMGRAENAKGGAVIVTSDGPVYVEGLAAWDEALLHRRVKAVGVRKVKQVLPAATKNEKGEWTQGAEGQQEVLEGAQWQSAE
ncbi:MAG: hypothetical protein AB1938_18990 [Myxococcota bacterium]